MKKTALLAALAIGSSFAYAEAAKSSYTVTVDFPYTSKYTFRGQQITEGAIQPSIELATADFYAGVWTSQPVVNNSDNEFDFYAGYKAKLNDKLTVDAGATVYYYPELNASAKMDRATTEGFLGLNADVKGFTPGVYAYYDIDLETTTLQAQLGYSLPLPEKGLSLDLSGNIGRVFDSKNDVNYTYWSVGANLPYKLNETSTVYAGVTYTNNNLKVAAGDFLSYTVGLTVGF